MINRKLKKILKQNTIHSPRPKQADAPAVGPRISRRTLIRGAQVAACLLLVCAMGIGYVAMVRMVGPQGDPNDTTPAAPGLQPTDTRDPGMDTGLDVVETCPPYSPDDTTYQAVEKQETFNGKKLVLAEPFKSGTSGDWWEYANPDMTADSVDMINLYRIMLTESALQCNTMQSASAYDHYVNWVKISSLTGNDAAIVTGNAELIGTLARQGLLEDLRIPDAAVHLDFSSADWPESMVEELSINGKLYFVSGKISLNTMASVSCVFADPKIDSKLGIDINKIVEEGKWTFDKMYALAADGKASLNGLALYDHSILALGTAAGIRLADNTPAPHASLSNGTALSFTDKLAELVGAGAVKMVYAASSEHIYQLFVVDSIVSVSRSNEHRVLLPMPAVEEGESYLSPVGDGAVYYAIVKGSDVQMAAAVMAKLAYYPNQPYAWDSRMQTYMDVLSTRYTISGEKTVQNLEIAMDKMTFSLDAFLTSSVTYTTLKNAINAANTNARRDILTQDYLARVIEAQLGTIK